MSDMSKRTQTKPQTVKRRANTPWFGARLRQLREAANVSQLELATRIGIHQAQLVNIERNRGNATFARVVQIAEALGLPLDAFAKEPQPAGSIPTDPDELAAYRSGHRGVCMAAFAAGMRAARGEVVANLLNSVQHPQAVPFPTNGHGGGNDGSVMDSGKTRRGRPRGSKNKTTLEREATEEATAAMGRGRAS